MERELSTLSLPPQPLKKIHDKGFNYVSDLRGVSSTLLCESTGLSFEEVNGVLNEVFLDAVTNCKTLRGIPKVKSAFEIWQKERGQSKVPTSCQQLDSILEGGLPLGHLVEIFGVPGSGKTQMCLQLCVNIQMPPIARDGAAWDAIYVDTQGNFVVDRLKDIAAACYSRRAVMNATIATPENVESMMEAFLRRVHVFRCLTFLELVATVQFLDEYLRSNDKVKLIVIDNISFLFRSFDKFGSNSTKRTQQLNSVGGQLIRIARNYNVLVTVVNQMTTRVMLADSESYLVSALGDSWAHLPSLRLGFDRNAEENAFTATVIKSPTGCGATARFKVTKGGIVDANPINTVEDNPRKKMRHT